MSDPLHTRIPCLRARVAGRDLLLPLRDLREVLPAMAVSVLPGRPKGIQGVVVHEGEFLPVLAWTDLPGIAAVNRNAQALAVLRLRLGLQLEEQSGVLDLNPETWTDPEPTEPWQPWLMAMVPLDGKPVPVLDADRLLAVLRGLRQQG